MREAGPRDRYTLEDVGDRDGWECAICLSPVSREFRAPHPCTPSVHHVVEVCQGGSDTLDNVALTHLFCNMDSHTWGEKSPAEARRRLAGRLLRGKRVGPRRHEAPDEEALALAASILSPGARPGA
ncbi:HNH endonuclease [Streptomyces carpinensis]|uniref:HNH endonuclease signature motif containing protein n=1 Tax=Streptomyces carpinensis TaxID=66369 RepID=A0ABV1VZ43_9ACTN